VARTVANTTLAVALLLALLQLTWWFGLHRYAADLATAVAPVARLEFAAVRSWPPTRPGLEQVEFTVASRPELALSAARVSLAGADPAWLVRWLLGLRPPLPERLTVQVQGLVLSDGLLRQLRQRAGVAGLVLPFEGVGCGEAPILDDQDYATLGWAQPRFDLELQLRPDHGQQRLELGLRVDRMPAGVASLQAQLVDVPERGAILAADLGGARLDGVDLRLEELGSLALRNEHCAARLGLDRAAYLDLHLERLHQHLAGLGLVPDEPVWAAYRQWLGRGGDLTLQARPVPGVPFAEYGAFAPEDRLRLLGLTVRMGDDEPVPVEATAARRAEGSFRPLPPAEPRAPAPDPSIEDDWAALDALATSDGEPGDAGDGTPAAASDDAPPAPAAVTPAVAAAPPRPRLQAINFSELQEQLGRLVRVQMITGNRYSGRVLGATDDAVELEIRRYGGTARLPINREQIDRIEITVTTPASPSG
jgi:hypothetical protein